ncbi:hypothetical protein SEA_COLUCCI_54 [Arthrobacter phage Colucci]|uniref:Uncharacterized protein n=1 Tax=Arthrobacter phage Colucci TaxID=2015834 RepID=A0A286N2W7_9CAUD|nr:hypothetical protein FDI27_gp054 [Arthrobacter phage Colucci]ASX98724.1 hypothetical protein SEA_COLUCCI_54 [Arthrobacter phage Colucci]
MTTHTNPTSDTLTQTPIHNVQNPVENLIKAIQATPGELSPAKALALVQDTLAGLTEVLPEEARERLSRLARAWEASTPTAALRDAEAVRHRHDAKRWAAQARVAEEKANRFFAMTPEEWQLHKATTELEQAKKSADRQEARDGAVMVDIDTHITDTVRVEQSEMRAAGWHHNSECKKFDPDAVTDSDDRLQMIEAARALRADTHYALQDWHDRAHGLTSWANCPNEPCKLLPEAAKVFKIGGRS